MKIIKFYAREKTWVIGEFMQLFVPYILTVEPRKDKTLLYSTNFSLRFLVSYVEVGETGFVQQHVGAWLFQMKDYRNGTLALDELDLMEHDYVSLFVL